MDPTETDARKVADILSGLKLPKLEIDDEFRALIPPLRKEEREVLEANIRDHGCDPLVVWRTVKADILANGHWRTVTGDILLDGHHRYEICQSLHIIFEVKPLEFASRDDAKRWINQNQVGRRNLSDTAFKYYLGRLYEKRKRQGARTDLTSDQSDQTSDAAGTVAEKIAREKRTSPGTVRRAAHLFTAINKIEEILGPAGPDAKRRILSEEISLNDTNIVTLADYPDAVRAFADPNVTGGQVRSSLRDEKRKEKYARISQSGTPTLTGGPFTVLYADPPWHYDDERPGIAASEIFPTMTVPDLIKLFRERLNDRLTPACVLFLWATNPILPAAFELLEGWGFKYRAHMIWEKPGPTLGTWVRGQHELLFIATRGNMPTPLESTLPVSIFKGAPWSRRHSAKPDRAYEIIEAMYPGVAKLEIFARQHGRKDCWTFWGNEIPQHEALE